MGCTSSAAKFFLNFLNFFLVLSGVAMVWLALQAQQEGSSKYAIFLIVVGVINFVAGVLGCFGICKEHVGLTTIYAGIILLSLLLQIGERFVPVDVEAVKQLAREEVDGNWQKEIQYPGAMNATQIALECCGRDRPEDYVIVLKRKTYPLSCFQHQKYNLQFMYKDGCIKVAQEKYVAALDFVRAGTWYNLGLTALMFLVAVYLVVRFRRKKDMRRSYNY